MSPDCIDPRMPLTRISRLGGVIWGISADTAGEWTPAPAERIARVTKMIHVSA